MTLGVEVRKKGYMIIPKSVHEPMGIREGDTLSIKGDNGRLVLEPDRRVDISYLTEKLEEHRERVSYARKVKLGELAGSVLEEEFDS
ncbi:hypothetical protein HS7_13440 [Sulfolobales archaeon HS-7]|nr:hypothetical protein HS7_13440 [Sulfolobales archaeon HS-7]